MRPLVLKLGGELVEGSANLATVVSAVAAIAAAERHLVLIHGGGREIDAALQRAGIAKRHVDGLRITDEATLAIVVSVLAGAVNPRFVAALNTAGVPAIGLTVKPIAGTPAVLSAATNRGLTAPASTDTTMARVASSVIRRPST